MVAFMLITNRVPSTFCIHPVMLYYVWSVSKIKVGLHFSIVGLTIIGPQEKLNIIYSVISPLLVGLYLLLFNMGGA